MSFPHTAPAAAAASHSSPEEDSDDSFDLFGDHVDTAAADLQREDRQQRAELARREKLARLPPPARRTCAQNRVAYVLSGQQQRLQPTTLPRVLSADECELVLAAVVDYVGRRGGLQTERHEKFATTDVPVADLDLDLSLARLPPHGSCALPSAVTAAGGRTTAADAVLGWATDRIVGPMAAATGFRPQDLGLKDLFVVCYCGPQEQEEQQQHQPATAGQSGGLRYPIPSKQASLAIHSDGCLLSFSLLLNHHAAFEGGGTYFKATGETFRVKQGDVLVHDAGLERE